MDIVHLRNRNLLMKMWAHLHFSALFPFLGARCAVYTLKSSGRVCPLAFSILAIFCSFSMSTRWIPILILSEMKPFFAKTAASFRFRVLLWCMLSDPSGLHHCILPKDDSLLRSLSSKKCWYAHWEDISSATMALADATPMILSIPIAIRATYT